MKQKVDLVKFNLTQTMIDKLIKFNNLKKQLMLKKSKTILDTNELKEINEIENNLNKIRNSFIKEFRLNNKEEILEYLRLKDNN